jgi:DNA-binding SARP family transcriptional activator/tetratricopeptide (TPR) repeat protein
VEFLLLGPLIVRSGDDVVPVQRGKQRTVLAGLLLAANRVVATDDLAEAVWGDNRPPSAQITVQNYVKRLRRAFGDDDRSLISTHSRGYQIRVEPGELDLWRFRDLLAAAQVAVRDGDWRAAAAQTASALELWRAEPLADVESELLLRREVPPLAQLRLEATEIKADASLHLGYHAEMVDDLNQLTIAHPLRERFWALLMLALYRSGRQADALAAYQRARTVLVEELGAEPGAELRGVQQRVLAGDADAHDQNWPQAPAAATVLRSGVAGDPAAWLAVPRLLPAPVRSFSGRAAELHQLRQLLEDAGAEKPGPVVITAIGGTAGVGKTALATHFAHQTASQFSDGQLYVNLRGFDPGGSPAAPADAIRGFLDALGVVPARIPAGLEAQAGLYRSLLADRKMLIVLDNARDEQQVRPLLPASPGTLVLVTSRNQLTGLAASDSARLLSLDVLSPDDAAQMLTARVGAARAAAEPDSIAEIAELCACLPLALSVAAARAAARPGLPLAILADELRDATSRLDTLDTGDPATCVRAVFSWSCHQLSPEAAEMFRLLGLHPGPDTSLAAAASLAGVPLPRARRHLGELARAHLITEHFPGRYAFHDLLRAYAADQGRATSSEEVRQQATGRVLDHYLHNACHAARLLQPEREQVTPAPRRPGVVAEQIADKQQALAWFEAELRVLVACVALAANSGLDAHAWQIPWAMSPFFSHRGHWREQVAIQRDAVAATIRLGDIAGEAYSRFALATAHRMLGRYEQALVHCTESLGLYRQLGDLEGQARVQQSLGMVKGRQDRLADALSHFEQALCLYQATGQRIGQARALNNLGFTHALLGNSPEALAFCHQALDLAREFGDPRIEGYTWSSLGQAQHRLGNHAQAADSYSRALILLREIGDRFTEAETLRDLGDALQAAGEARQARDAWQQALDILTDLQHPAADEIRPKLAAADP